MTKRNLVILNQNLTGKNLSNRNLFIGKKLRLIKTIKSKETPVSNVENNKKGEKNTFETAIVRLVGWFGFKLLQ